MNRSHWALSFKNAWTRELLYLTQHKAELALITLLPLILLGILAWLLSGAVIRELPIAVVDQDHSDVSRELIRRLDASPGLKVAEQPAELEKAWSLVRSLSVYAVVYIPDNARRDMQRGQGTAFVYYNASFLTAGQGASRDVVATMATFNQVMFQEVVALRNRTGAVGRPGLVVQSNLLYNSARSYEHFLLGLLFPAVLHLVAALAMVSALGRELRDETGAQWLAPLAHSKAAVVGKLFPYILLFTAYGCIGLIYLAYVRGGGIAGSFWILLLGQLGLYSACGSIALMLVGLTKDMGSSLSMVGLYVGTALAFSGATFPVLEGSLFTRIWNSLLPLTAYIKLQAQQVDMGAPWSDAFKWLCVLGLFVVIPSTIGMAKYLKIARGPELAS